MSVTTKKITGAIACFAIAAAVGCGGGSQSATSPAAVVPQTGTMAFSFKFPSSTAQTSARDPKYVSANANSAVITLNGISVTIGSNTNSQCVNQTGGAKVCTVNINAPAGLVTYSGSVYDGLTGNGNVLGTFSGTTTITAGQTTPVTVTVNGTIASVVLTPVSGSSLAPCVLAVNSTNNCGIVVNAKDADGFTIVPPGNFSNGPITLSITGDTTNFAFTSSTQTTLAAPVPFTTGSSILVSYNGKATTGATITASVPGLPASAITNALLLPGASATPAPTATSSTTPPPSATPTSAPSVTPSPSPSPSPSSSPSPFATPVSGLFACNATPLTVNSLYYFISLEGNVPSGGGAFTFNSSNSNIALKGTVVSATATAQPSASASPAATPTPAATARPVNFYGGTYTVTALSGTTSGCVTLYATAGGTPLSEARVPLDRLRLPDAGVRLPRAGGSASTLFIPNLATGAVLGPGGQTTVSSINLNLAPMGTSSGSFVLADGASGTLTVALQGTFNAFPNPTPSPTGSPFVAPTITATYNGTPLSSSVVLPFGNSTIVVTASGYTGLLTASVTSCTNGSSAAISGSNTANGPGPVNFTINATAPGSPQGTCLFVVSGNSGANSFQSSFFFGP